MDQYLEQNVSPLSWCDANALTKPYWDCGDLDVQTGFVTDHSGDSDVPNRLLTDSLGVFDNDEKESSASMISSSQTVECLVAQDTTSIVLGGETVFENGLLSGAADSEKCNGYSSNGVVLNGEGLEVDNMVQYCKTIPSLGSFTAATPAPINQFSTAELASIGNVTSGSFGEMRQYGINDTVPSEVHGSLADLQKFPITSEWFLPSDDGSFQLCNMVEQDIIPDFGLQGCNVDNVVGNRYVEMNNILQEELAQSVTSKGRQFLQNHPLPSFTSEPQMTMTPNELPAELKNTSNTQAGGCNGTGKPRVRARRGQATDPHSIAERLRREKIAERMKNLQELVPNANKSDKASMLDEIIEYVKYLQLQVKVLSMSRMGAAGAVAPLITDGQTEGSNGLSLLPSSGQGADTSLSADQIAFEEEVVKLMESSITEAMQFLQTKGLCLMPVALAAAISNGKESDADSDDTNKYFADGLVHNNSSSSSSSNSNSNLSGGLGIHRTPSDNDILIGKPNKQGTGSNGCDWTTIKHEEVKSTCAMPSLKLEKLT